MSTTLQEFQGSNGLTPNGQTHLPARTTKALLGLQQNTILAAAQVHAQTFVAREAMYAVADLSELEGQLASVCPLATSRLEFIANTATMSIGRMLHDSRS